MCKCKKVILILFIIIILCSISALIYFLLDKFNITSIKTLRRFIGQFGVWSWVVYLFAQVLISTPIFVMPLEDETWVTLSILLFGVYKGFILSVIGMIIISSLLYFVGNKFGVKVAEKIVGKKELASVQSKFDAKNKMSLPFMYLIPFFPHDSLCIVAGLVKMKFIYFFIVTLFMRSMEIVYICFLGNGITYWKNLSILEWVFIVNLAVVDIYLLTKLKRFMENKIAKKG